jgi:DNA-binding beta-propeller fold protein YncE
VTTRPIAQAFVAILVAAAGAAAEGTLMLEPDAGFFKLPPGANFGPALGGGVLSDGHVVVFHRGPDPLMEFDGGGRYVRTLAAGLFTKPHGLHVDREDNIWVTDTARHLVVKLDRDGRVLMVLGVTGEAGEWHEQYDVLLFNQPTDVVTADDGTIYVTDGYGNSRIVKLAADGTFLSAWGEPGDGPGQLASPHNIVIDPRGRLVVTDRDNSRIQLFDRDGGLLGEWVGFDIPNGLELTPDGHLLLTDSGIEQLLELDLDGNVLGRYGGPGKGPGRFGLVHWVARARDGSIFVSEVLNWRVQRLVPIRVTEDGGTVR